MKAPKIVDKTFEKLVEEGLSLAAKGVPEWSHQEGDAGLALLKISAHMREEVISRLNRVPEKGLAAFLDMLGIDLLPAQSARVPVTFLLSDGRSEDVYVPEGTEVAASETERRDTVTFETTTNLSVTPASIIRVHSVNPTRDEIFDHFEKLKDGVGFKLFSGTDIQKHVIHIGHNELFKIGGKTKIVLSVTLDKTFSFDIFDLIWKYWDGEKENKFEIEKPKLNLENTIDIIILTVPTGEIKEKEVNGISCLWVEAEPKSIDTSYSSLRIKDIKVSIVRINTDGSSSTPDSLTPDICLYNSFAIDPSKSFYPFGTQPRIFDIFYLSSEEAFSKKGGEVTIAFSGTAKVTETQEPPLIVWDYWNGAQWKAFLVSEEPKENKKNNVSQFSPKGFNGNISFKVPLDFDKIDVNGRSGYWIRARLMNNGYEVGYDEKTKKFEFNPPVVNTVKISYNIEKISLQHCLTYNNLEFEDVTSALGTDGFKPFTPLSGEHPALYLGLKEPLRDGLYSLFFHLSDKSQLAGKRAELVWQCLARSHDQERECILDAEDHTEQLSRSDVLQIIGPSEHLRSMKFGSKCYWLKGVQSSDLSEGKMMPEIKGIYLNTVWAEQRETVKDEILGSSDGEKKSTYPFLKKPVISSEIWVREGAIIHEAERKERLLTEDILDENGKIIDTWVRWTGVEDFYSSGPRSRHYVLDGTSGRIAFGDGVNGMIPPIGRDNIEATYRWGGGITGNVAAGEVSLLKSAVEGVDGVINRLPAEGGADTEPVSSALKRGPEIVRHRDRAVTLEDFERLAKSSSGYIARVKCLTEGSSLKITIIPWGKDSRPMPSISLLDTVREHLRKRCLCTLPGECIDIKGPDYVEATVSVDVTPVSIDKAASLRGDIIRVLNSYLHPLTGGPDGAGWSFGRGLYISDLYAMIEGIKGVDHVQKLMINDNASDLSIKASQMICSGNHSIFINMGA